MGEVLNARQESFVKLMAKSGDHAARGFELLSKRDDASIYFDAIKEQGLLDPSQNLQPVEVPDKPGFVRIPYWPALDFLHTVARLAGEQNDNEMANKVLDVVKNTSRMEFPDGSKIDNYHAFRKFAEIIGLVPLEVLSDETIALVPNWLRSKYDRSLSAKALSDGIIGRLLDSDSQTDLGRACLLLRYCTDFEREPEDRGNDLRTVVEEYWLRELFSKHYKAFGSRAGAQAATVLDEQLRRTFADHRAPYRSSLWRPAIEDHAQNRGRRGPENLFVEGLRDIVLEWSDTGDPGAERYVAALLVDPLEIMRRIALHVIDERFERYRHLIEASVDPALFSSPYRHELYRLLDRHFAEFPDEAKDAVIAAIKAIPLDKSSRRPVLSRAHVQRDWASAICQKGYKPADDLFATLDGRKGLGKLSDHPDFLSYFTMHSGPGPSPFTAEFVLAAAIDGTLIEKTSAFKGGDGWRGPTEEGLWDMVKSVVSDHPDVFVDRLGEYTTAPMPLVHAMINGLRQHLKESDSRGATLPTSALWAALLTYFEKVLAGPSFWVEEPSTRSFLPTRNWVLNSIADILSTGTQVDKTAYPKQLLPQGWRIIGVLLDRSPYIVDLEHDDIVTQVINTPRGRAVEAAVNHALRVCRIESKRNKSHAGAWVKLQPLFNKQLSRSKGTNFEFSTLVGQFVANFDYLSSRWLENNFSKIFDRKQSVNFKSAVAGLAYSTLTRRVYNLLVRHGVIDVILDEWPRGNQEAQRLIEFMCLALMWGDEDLESSRFAKLFEPGRESELAIATDWLWSLHDGKITEKQRRTILSFWEKAIKWSNEAPIGGERLQSRLCRLAVYLNSLDGKSLKLLEAVAPYASDDHNLDSLVENLYRLAPANPEYAARLVGLVISRIKPYYDVDNNFQNLLRYLADNGQREAVLEYTNTLINYLPGMVEFYAEISR